MFGCQKEGEKEKPGGFAVNNLANNNNKKTPKN